ncbi:MAG TPA: hypothetical protein VF158_12770 [Longimicrobiales bacterium]
MRRFLIHTWVTAVFVLGVGGCAPALGGGDGAVPPGAREVLFQVRNNNWSDVTVYLLNGGTRLRLGMVTSMSEELFRVPGGLVSTTADVRLLLDPLGSAQGFVTEPILVQPGQTVQMNVENHLPLTNWAVW